MVPFTGNLTWEALKRVNSIDDNERELILSMVGTVIYYPLLKTATPMCWPDADQHHATAVWQR
jgi:hypothetical protein